MQTAVKPSQPEGLKGQTEPLADSEQREHQPQPSVWKRISVESSAFSHGFQRTLRNVFHKIELLYYGLHELLAVASFVGKKQNKTKHLSHSLKAEKC